MEFADVMSAIQTISILVAVFVGCGTIKSRQDGKVSDLTEMRMDIKYIKETVDKINPMELKLAEVDASTRSAHKRIDDHIKEHGKEKG